MALLQSIFSYFPSFIPGDRLVDGGDCLNLVKILLQPTTGITALAGGGGPGATLLQYGWNRIDTVVTTADSVMLPPAVPGFHCAVNNAGGNSVQVFGQQANMGGLAGGDRIVASNSDSPAAVATGIALADTKVAIFYCFTVGIWKEFLSA